MTGPKRIRRIVARPTVATWEPTAPTECAYDVIEEWVPEDLGTFWTAWREVDRHVADDPTYYPQYGRRDGFHIPIRALHPHRKTTITYERKLIHRWVDRTNGLMARTADVEYRTVTQ
jgi:hypothetical protein